ncbi:3-oxoacyl-[acyl-carrier-protein] synthase III C-terminal domain-containing protein [Micromonospora sp. B11E3]|uniref:3-oxoacyl-[acyl-carrier-protein] synthase III C-terminal domain-containing protein n=1 Tax=Micromonospora sp. B11E3 TaxID=3153562 RepID=UPI00325F139E
MLPTAGIIGHGYSVPDGVRRNDDPAFASLNQQRNSQGVIEAAVFRGLDRRRVLAKGEPIEEHVVRAANSAMERANLTPGEIDRLYGYVTVSQYATPNSLYQVHHLLRLPPEVMVVPINSEYSNFLLGLVHAAEAVAAGAAGNSLVACGANWSGHMNFTKGHSFSIGDAAGAAVVGPSDRFVITDHITCTLSSQYHGLTMTTRTMDLNGLTVMPVDPVTNLPIQTYDMTQTGIEDLAGVVKDSVATIVQSLLERNNVNPSDLTLMTHQGSRLLMDHWQERIRPKAYLDTLAEHGNMTVATYPVNLSYFFEEIDTAYTVIVAVGCGLHVTAVLLRN